MLLHECDAGGVERWQPCGVADVRRDGDGWVVATARGEVAAAAVVVATGGLPVPQIGATDFGLRLAERFGHRIVEPRPALVPLTFDARAWAPFVPMAGIALPVSISTETPARRGTVRIDFAEDLLFTHRGLSGPAVLQISSYWRPGGAIRVDLAPGQDLADQLAAAKVRSRRQLGNELAAWLPQRLADAWLAVHGPGATLPMPQVPDLALRRWPWGWPAGRCSLPAPKAGARPR
jgi:hypothetical protein